MGYHKMWEVIIESVLTLQIQHQVPIMIQVLMGDFNAHIDTNKTGTVPKHILLERRNADFQGYKVTKARFSHCVHKVDLCREAIFRQLKCKNHIMLNGQSARNGTS